MTLDLEAFSQAIDLSINELVDSAFSGNIERRHHLESAVADFNSIGILIEAEKIVKELWADDDEPSASQVESSDATHDASHHTWNDVQDTV